MDDLTKIALETISKEKQAIIFVSTRASAEKTAETIAKLTDNYFPDFEETVLKAASTPTKQCKRLARCVKKGIAFHHAGLMNKQKNLIEDEFRSGKLKIICATPTLAAGLSLPAYRVIIKSLKRYSGRWGMDWIPVLEYLQMAGRAGRPEYEKEGQSITIAKDLPEKEEIYERYICGEPEEIYSKLAVEPVLRTYLLSLISSGIIRDEQSMQDFFSKTFWAFQFGDMKKLQTIMEKMLVLLEQWEFVTTTSNKSDFVIASQLQQGNILMRPTALGKRVSELYLDPLTARHLIDGLLHYTEEKKPFSLLQLISSTLEMRPPLRVKKSEENKINEALLKNYDELLIAEPSAFAEEYNDFFNSIKTALYFCAWIDEKDEEFLLEEFGIRPGEIRMKNETADWLLYSCLELSDLLNLMGAKRDLRKLRFRLKHGVKEELLPLLKLKGIGRIRARKLYSHGFQDLQKLRVADFTSLQQLLGKAIAIRVKEQLGDSIKQVPKGTRKGQLSMEKYT